MEEYSGEGDATENNIADAHFTLDTKGYEHTLRLCNIYCFFPAAMVASTSLSVALYIQCLSC